MQKQKQVCGAKKIKLVPMYPTIHFSVVIPAFNAAAGVGVSLQSLLAQTHSAWEAIVVDDGSTDDTFAVAQAFANTDKRIRVLQQTNEGVSAARNKGLSATNFQWVLFLDAEDYLAEDYFHKMAQKVLSDEALDAVVCGWNTVYPNGKIEAGSFPPFLTDLFPALAVRCAFVIHACVLRKSLAETVGGFEKELSVCEDWDFWQRIARAGARFGCVKETLAFYRMSQGSLSRNGTAFFSAAIRVLRQGYTTDKRVKTSVANYKEGLRSGDLVQREYYWASWCAGMLILQNKDAGLLLKSISSSPSSRLDAIVIADNLIDSVCRAACQEHSAFVSLWHQNEAAHLSFLQLLEEQSETTGLANEVTRQLARRSLPYADSSKRYSLSQIFIEGIDIAKPIGDLLAPANTTHAIFIVSYSGQHLGNIELPVIDGVVSAYVLKDAIADQLSWKVLGCFFKQTAAKSLTELAIGTDDCNTDNFEELQDRFGWQLFLNQLWKEKKETSPGDKRGKANWQGRQELQIEISADLPVIKSKTTDFPVTLTAGGIPFGRFQVKGATNIISPLDWQNMIEANYGFELCKVAVREAVIGHHPEKPHTIGERLQMLANAKAAKGGLLEIIKGIVKGGKSPEQASVFTIQRRPGLPGSSVSRRAELPVNSVSLLAEMARTAGEQIIRPKGKLSRVVYAPESIVHSHFNDTVEVRNDKADEPQRQYDRHHFETLFSKSADPWKYTHPYEQTKYEQTLSLVQSLPIKSCLELACAEGHFTVQLAPHVKHLVAADISKVALERAAERCSAFPDVEYQQLDISRDAIDGTYDLIVCSEVLYYMGGIQQLKEVAYKMSKALSPEGYIVMAHAHQVIDEPDKPGFDWGLLYGAKAISDIFCSLPELNLKKEVRTPLYRIQLFQQKSAHIPDAEPAIAYLEQPTPVPFQVEKSVRWKGGQSTMWSEKVETKQLPILMYHSVAPNDSNEVTRYQVSPEQLEEQLCYLRDSGYYGVGINEWISAILKRRPLPGRAVALTFDDGYKNFYEFAWPLLEKYGFTAIVFLVSDLIGKTNEWDKAFAKELPLMDLNEIRFLHNRGIAFGSHTATHAAMASLSPQRVVEEAARSRATLQELLGVPIQSIAYPYGSTNGAVLNLCGGVGYVAGLSCIHGLSSLVDAPLHLPRIEVPGSDQLKDFVAKLTV